MSHRPELHLVPDSGILQGPAGVLLDGRSWHLFYQYKPAADAPARWGHSYAEDDPFYWLDCDDVLAPEAGEDSLRAGSTISNADGATLYYTAVKGEDTAIGRATFASIAEICEVSNDRYVLDASVQRTPVSGCEAAGYSRFRSPCVVPDWAASAAGGQDREAEHEGWLMLALTGPTADPQPVILRSANGAEWSFEGALSYVGDPGFPAVDGVTPPVVAPRIIRLRDDVSGEIFDIILVTLEAPGSEQAGYLVGTLRGTEFHVTTGYRRLDWGHDYTRPRNTNTTPGTAYQGEGYTEALIIGLLNGAGRRSDAAQHHSLATEGWANVLSLPRHLTLQDGVLYQTPPRHLTRAVEDSQNARLWSALATVPAGSSIIITVLDGDGQPAATITHAGDQLVVDRSLTRAFGRLFADSAPAVAPLAEGEEDTLTVVMDGSALEVYADSGLVVMSSRLYVEGGCSGFRVETTGAADIQNSFEVHGS